MNNVQYKECTRINDPINFLNKIKWSTMYQDWKLQKINFTLRVGVHASRYGCELGFLL